ncbi:DNA topoisomerase VI subunit B [Candidatus Micrarchaeota archaeon]|nr:MAG: DNA topoisomerase VI subunit B [Candidatus Micrarchaeota archaeon]
MPEKHAKEIFKEFREHSIAEFFKKNRQMLGYSGPVKSLTTVIHEYLTNSLDACEEAGILPDIFVQIKRLGPNYYLVINEDNGPGIPKNYVGKAFGTMLAGTKFHRFQQARGQQGIGGAGCVMFSQITTGKPTKIITSTGKGVIFEADISIDVKTNSPKVSNAREYPGTMRGTRIETHLKHVKYQKGEQSPDEYIRRTALANPHARITYIDPDGIQVVYDRVVDKIPKIPKKTKPHPKGVEVDDLMTYASVTKARSIKGFLVNDFTRFSTKKVKELQEMLDFDLNKTPQSLTWEEAEKIVKAIKKMNFIAPPTDVLIPIGEEHLRKALQNILEPEFERVLTRPPAIYRGGVPFIVEVAIAYGGKAGRKSNNKESVEHQMEIMRFANRVPLLFDAGSCAITKAVQSVNWKKYGIQPEGPITVLVNFTSIHVPYTSAGKQAVADEEEIVKEIRLTLMDAARRIGIFISGKRKKYEKEKRLQEFMRYIPETAASIAKITGESEEVIRKRLEQIVKEKYDVEEGGKENGEQERQNGS